MARNALFLTLVLLAKVHSNDILLVARKKDLWYVDLSSPDEPVSRIPVTGVRNAVAIDYDPVERFIYWSDVKTQNIQRARLNGSDQSVLHDINTQTVDGLAVHWEARRLYWTNTHSKTLEMSLLNGTDRQIILSKDMENPRAIVVHKEQSMLYWTDWGESPRIERVFVNGTGRQILINSGILYPNGLTLDIQKDMMYWADAGLDKLEGAALDGTHRLTLLNGLAHAYSIDKYGDYMYWSDWETPNIQKIDITSRDPSTVSEVMSYATQLMGINMKHIDGKVVLFMAATTHIREFIVPSGSDLSNGIGIGTKIPLIDLRNAIALEYNGVDKHIYWTDYLTKSISRAFKNGTGQEILLNTGIDTPDGLAISVATQKIFWTDTGTDTIETCDTDGSNRQVVIQSGLDEPRAIALDDVQSTMFWTDWGTKAKIERAHYDGSSRVVLINTDLVWPNGLALDVGNRRMYWGDGSLNKIESSRLDGTDRQLLVGAPFVGQIFGLSLIDDYLYWTDWKTQDIRRGSIRDANPQDIIMETKAAYFMDVSVAQTSVNMCQIKPCDNGGSCINMPNGYKCECKPGYHDDNCNLFNHCHIAPCLNGGSCINEKNGYRCDCSSNFLGQNCQTSNYCRSSTCLNGGSCKEEKRGHACRCQPGFIGSNCEKGNARVLVISGLVLLAVVLIGSVTVVVLNLSRIPSSKDRRGSVVPHKNIKAPGPKINQWPESRTDSGVLNDKVYMITNLKEDNGYQNPVVLSSNSAL